MDYLTVKEVAELKGCTVRYINRNIKENKLEAIQELNPDNNCMQYKIPVSALPEELKARYYKRKQQELGLQPELKESETALKQRSKGIKKPVQKKRLDEFTETEREQIALWCGILKEWQAARSKFKNKSEADPLFCGKIKLENPDIDISPDILYRKYKAYRNNDFQGLVENRGGWNKGKCSIDDTVWSIFTSYYLTTHRLTVENCYAKAVAVCREYYPELVSGIPSSRTFRRHAEKIPHAVLEYGRFGQKAFTDKYLEYVERDVSTLKVNDVWIADNHTLDFFTLSDDGEVHRPSITTFQEAKSGIIVAAELCDHPNSDTTRLALRSATLQGFGIPMGVYFDNGSEFLTGDLAVRGHRKKSDWQKVEIPVQILSLLGIEMINALPRNARAKPIERFFYTFKEHYSKSVESYCGGKGTGIISESGTMLATAYNTMVYENSVVKKGGNKKGVFTSQNQQTKEAMKTVKEGWKRMNSSSNDIADNVVVLNAGMDFRDVSQSAMDMQLNQNKQTNSAEVCGLFGVPPSMMSGTLSAEAKENFITNTLTPLLNIFETAADSDLLLESEKGKRYFAFDTRELTRGDILKRYQAYAIGKKNGFIMINDIREQEDMPPIDFPFIQLNLSDVLYNPETKEIYTPNTDAVVDLKGSGRVMHEIDTLYHSKYEGKRKGWITISKDTYRFEIHEFNEYNIYEKWKDED